MAFLGLRWTPGNRDRSKAAARLRARLGEGWSELAAWRGLVLLHRGSSPVTTLPHGMGFVFGRFCGREPDPSPPCQIFVDPAPGWIRERWGAYVAVLLDTGFDLVRVLRDPSGARQVFLSELDDVHVFFSHAEDFVGLAGGAAPDKGFIRSFLKYPPHLGRRTGLVGVQELAPGECAIYAREDWRIEACWTPHAFERAITRLNWECGKRELRQAAEACVRARTRDVRKIALRLSGGFDSSVMLGLLRHCSAAHIVCVNEYWEGAAEGDERAQVRDVAEANGLVLHELRFEPAAVRYERALAAPLSARPTLSVLGRADANVAAFYASLGCELITSGQGGDHLFHRSRTVWIAADALWDRASLDRAFEIAVETARLTGKPVWDVAWAMAAGALGAKPRLTRPSEAMGTLAKCGGSDEAPADHAWLEGLCGCSPARAQRIQHLLHALSYFEDSCLDAAGEAAPLLMSQPIIETCLRIPPYVMTQGGVERALARSAFADLAPDSVTTRVTKGETTRYFTAILAANRDWISSTLIDGKLVALGVLDGAALRAALARNWIESAIAADGLYALIAAECWLRNLDRECSKAAPRH